MNSMSSWDFHQDLWTHNRLPALIKTAWLNLETAFSLLNRDWRMGAYSQLNPLTLLQDGGTTIILHFTGKIGLIYQFHRLCSVRGFNRDFKARQISNFKLLSANLNQASSMRIPVTMLP